MSVKAEQGIRQSVWEALGGVAPDIEPDKLDTMRNIRDQVDFDSMDFLNFVIALHRRYGLDIPESDYPQLFNIDGAVHYLSTHL
jgi:acyl carrier protein